MSKPNKIINIIVLAAFFFNLMRPGAEACWWKSITLGNGSPTLPPGFPPGSPYGNTPGGFPLEGYPNQRLGLDPVFLHNGDFIYEFQDLSIPCPGIPLEFKHTYKSQSMINNRFGYGWDMDYRKRLVALANCAAVYIDGTNRSMTFLYVEGQYITPFEKTDDKLVQNADGTWTLIKKHGAKYHFNENGLITKMEDRNGNSLSFYYNAAGILPIKGGPGIYSIESDQTIVVSEDYQLEKVVADGLNKEINFSYDSNGRVSSITDNTGRTIKYEYSTLGELLSITRPPNTDFPQGTTVRFTYNESSRLSTITDAKGQVYLSNFYNGQGLVDAQEYGGKKSYLTYKSDTVTEIRDAKGLRTEYTFNNLGNPIRKEEFTAGLRASEPASYVTLYEYNAHGKLTKVIYPKGNSILYTYDALDNLLEERRKAPSGSTEADIAKAFTYEPQFNFIKTEKGPKGNITTYYYDYEESARGDLNGDGITNQSSGNLVKITYPEVNNQAPEVKYTYNSHGQVVTTTDADNNVIKYEYYPYGVPGSFKSGYLWKVIRAYGALNLTTEMDYDNRGNLITLKDPKGNITNYEYDSHNSLIKTTQSAPFNYITQCKYDANDKLIQLDRQTGDALNPWQSTYYAYDILDRVETVTDPLGNTTTFGYDANGNKTLVKDAELNSTVYQYDERNLLWLTIDAKSSVTEYDYDLNGKLIRIKDGKGNTTTYAYDGFDRTSALTYADNAKEEYSYDVNSNLTSKKTPNGKTIYYDYDALNRLVEKGLMPKGTVPDSAVSYVYDIGSKLTQVSDKNGTIAYDFDAAERVTKVTYPDGKSVSYAYDENSNRTRLTYPNAGYINYEYDQLNRLTAIKVLGSQSVAQYSYDALSRRQQRSYLNNTQTNYTYDKANRLIQLANRKTGQPGSFSQYDYTYDKVGNRLSMAAASGTHSYSYDQIYQLIQSTVDSPSSTVNYNYDALGNRVSTINGGTTDYTTNNLNQYTQVGAAAYAYDANGNLTGDGVKTYAYDYENRLTSATSASNEAAYTYDAYGRRIKKAVTQNSQLQTQNYIYDGDQIIVEFDNTGGNVKKYIYGPGIDEPICIIVGSDSNESTYYYHYDGLGSVTNLTDESGAVVETYSYDDFGKPTIKDAAGNTLTESAIGNEYFFTGRQFDKETGLYFYRSRYYSPDTGRFLQRDKIGYYDSMNLYAYVGNNPINYVDPSGNNIEEAVARGGMLAGAAVGAILSNYVAPALVILGILYFGEKALPKIIEYAKTRARTQQDKCKPAVVIGEGMMNRVIRFAGEHPGVEYYRGIGNTPIPPGVRKEDFYAAHNIAWIQRMMAEGRTIIDIGPTPINRMTGRKYGTSPYYYIERHFVEGYPKHIEIDPGY